MGYSRSLLLLSFLFAALLVAAESTHSSTTEDFKSKDKKYIGELARRLLAGEEKAAITEDFKGKEKEYYGSYGHGGGYGYGHGGGYGYGHRGGYGYGHRGGYGGGYGHGRHGPPKN